MSVERQTSALRTAVEWDSSSFPCVFQILDYLRYCHIMNHDMIKATEVRVRGSHKCPQEMWSMTKIGRSQTNPHPSLLRKKGLELEN